MKFHVRPVLFCLPWLFTGCSNCADGLPIEPERSLPLQGLVGADDPESCKSCHPRQFQEWVGSSHNYGGGLDPVYQTLEFTANYYLTHRAGRPALRQNTLCIGCHSPSAMSFNEGLMSPNASFRLGAEDMQPYDRELERPTQGGLLPPPGRAIEAQENPDLEAEEVMRRRRFTYQGITCDACHKAGRPFNDLEERDDRVADLVCREDTLECAEDLLEACRSADDPRCRRISKEGHHDAPPHYELGISNVGFVLEREGSVRYGPFKPEDLTPNTAHDFSTGATPEAQNYVVSFPGEEPADVRPYIQTSQYCGACHDVRLPGAEPVHEEPFIRLENLYTEWFLSPLNLHPGSDFESLNPYLDDQNRPRRIVCQDCHMSLYPYAPPGVFPGEYTASGAKCDDHGRCGETLFTGGALASLRPPLRSRVSTHNMTGPDVGLGFVGPTPENLGLDPDAPLPESLALPNQKGDHVDSAYGLPLSLDARRRQLMKTAASISLAGTPEVVDPSDRDCSDGLCCDESGHCNLPIKAWLTNVNGGHNVAAGFSQERQMWVELTVQDMGKIDPSTGLAEVVDCAYGSLADLYGGETLEEGRYPRWQSPVPHTVSSANDLFNRLFGVPSGQASGDHDKICRGLSGHLIDKPHHETRELAADGRLGDEDVWLHRIGNTTPELADGTNLLSWHVVDFGLDADLTADPVGPRVARNDQFHVVGNDAFACELTLEHPSSEGQLDPTHPVVTLDPVTGATATVATSYMSASPLKWRVTDTSDERLEILYPYPEFGPLMPSLDGGALHGGERFGLVYPTNIFYRVCGCPTADGVSCEQPERIEGPNAIPGVTGLEAQVPWVATFPVLPIAADMADENRFHFPLSGARSSYGPLLENLGLPTGTRAVEAFTFVPLNSNHMPNNRALKFYKPQRHYWDIRFDRADVVGPIRVSVKLYLRHFPPEFLRIMSRSARTAYDRAVATGQAQELFPNGPLVVEGAEDTARWPRTGNVDNLQHLLVDEAVFFVAIDPAQNAASPLTTVPEKPLFDRDVKPILKDNCVPCHSDVLRHGRLILDYDAFPEWDDPARGEKSNAHQDARQNLVGKSSAFGAHTLVVPGDPDRSFLWQTLTQEQPDPNSRVRRMPLFTDTLSPRELETIRRWIATGAE